MSNETSVSRHLGKASVCVGKYDPTLLVKEARSRSRQELNISSDKLPFVGKDVWNNYEVSCLLDNGMPVTAIAKIVYDCTSDAIIESKSMKLYWNSFNMEKMGKTIDECYAKLQAITEKDLSTLIGSPVMVSLVKAEVVSSPIPLFGYVNIDELAQLVATDKYKHDESLLTGKQVTEERVLKVRTSLLRGLCCITSQPDTGDVYIHYKGNYDIDVTSILQYIVSNRETNEFHEPSCEKFFNAISKKFEPKELAVFCLYNRRGSLDINPMRATSYDLIPVHMTDPDTQWSKAARQ